MEVSAIIAGIDAQIQKLQEARAILESVSAPAPAAKAGRGRPKGSTNAVPAAKKAVSAKAAAKTTPAKAAAEKATATTKRKLSPEGRKRIADAMKRRWAERRKTAAK